MKKFSRLRYIIALLLLLATVSTVTTPTSTKGTITTMSEPGYNWWLSTR